MTTNWTKPRREIIDIAIMALRRGYYTSIDEAAERLTRYNYRGESRPIARALLYRDVSHVYYERHGGQTEHQEAIIAMATTLHAEGWRYIQDHRDSWRGFWKHQSGVDVNLCGGSFPSFAEATERTFNSETRKLIHRRNDHA